MPLPLELVRAAIENRAALSQALHAEVPPDWPGPDLVEALPMMAERLAADPAQYMWYIWVAIFARDPSVVGDVGFRGPPDETGTVEIGYSIVPSERRRGYATEAAGALAGWALHQPGVRCVIAETELANLASQRVLQKIGMQLIASTDSLLRWQLLRDVQG